MLGWRKWRVESLDTVSLLEISSLCAGHSRLPRVLAWVAFAVVISCSNPEHGGLPRQRLYALAYPNWRGAGGVLG
jgi:hypothetical protein